jgi:hypothetical protein
VSVLDQEDQDVVLTMIDLLTSDGRKEEEEL